VKIFSENLRLLTFSHSHCRALRGRPTVHRTWALHRVYDGEVSCFLPKSKCTLHTTITSICCGFVYNLYDKYATIDARQSLALARPAAPLAACVQRISCPFYRTLTPPTECHQNSISIRWIKPTKIGCHGNVPWRIKKTNFRLIIYSQILPTPANFAKVGAVDVDIIGLKRIVKMRNSSRTDSLSGPLSRAC